MKCPYRKIVTTEFNGGDTTISSKGLKFGSCGGKVETEDFAPCYMAECAFWDNTLNELGECRRIWREKGGDL